MPAAAAPLGYRCGPRAISTRRHFFFLHRRSRLAEHVQHVERSCAVEPQQPFPTPRDTAIGGRAARHTDCCHAGNTMS
ncbi:hypothetical protein DB771_09110 [Burkholderia sp. AU29985]|jgi:hypothetical protein|nr:hypothetical protein XM57_00390 [Burkholderia cepacia]AYZ95998.1 hypothetical protein EGY28_12820 [Burkholderia dolosa]ETP61264.1 hypothetical protein BDSB_26350 [Burkholderia dolosa PC543]PRE43961.1 hypothetical protein C6P87_23895 [Burkholderia sp. AU12872]PUA77209.1 hypothetical protein DB771_09110 [Burkholderia sp. AU29985]